MSKVSQKDAISTLKKFIKKEGGSASAWYCGITNDPQERIFAQHKVNKNRGTSKYIKCNSKNCAENVEKKMLKAGHGGDTGGGRPNSEYVYVYKKTKNTKQ